MFAASKTFTVTSFMAIVVATLFSMPASALTVPSSDSDGKFTVSVGSLASPPYTEWQLDQRVGTSGSWVRIAALPSNGSRAINISQGGTYYYRARQYNPSYSYWGSPPGPVASAWTYSSGVVVSFPPPGAPRSVHSSDGSKSYDGSYTIRWYASTGDVDYYRWRQNSGSWQSVGTALTTPTLTRNNGTYRYDIAACNNYGCTQASAYTVTVDKNISPTISRSTATSTNGHYSVSWSGGRIAGKAAEHIWIYENGSPQIVYGKTGNGTPITTPQPKALNKTTQGTWNYYTLSCVNVSHNSYTTMPIPNTGSCLSSGSTSVNVNFPTPATAGIPTLGDSEGTYDTDGRIDISWAAVSHAQSYRILYGKTGTSKTQLTQSGTSKSFTGLADGVWEFQVRACNAANECGSYSAITRKTVQLPPPITLSSSVTTSTDGRFTLNWTDITISQAQGESRVYMDGAEILKTQGLSYPVGPITNGTYEMYVAKCIVGSTSCPYRSNTVHVQVVHPPHPVSAFVLHGLEEPNLDANGSLTLTWTGNSYASYYLVSYGRRGDITKQQKRVDTGVSAAMTLAQGLWELSVKACNALDNCVESSEQVSVMVSITRIDESYEYDNLGRLREATYEGVTETYNLDEQDNRTSVQRN